MRTVDEIYGGLATDFTARTGQEVGQSGELAARLYAVAAQIYALGVQTEWTGRQCFPQTAGGTYLEQHAFLRGLTRRAATKAEGVVRFTADKAAGANLTIPMGTVCMTAGLMRFETTAAATLAAGSTQVDVPAKAARAGESGNVPAGSIITMAVAPVGVNRCSNPGAFSGGEAGEDDEGLRARVLETFRRLPNGANAAFYEQGAMTFPEVVAATVLPRSRGVGTVDVVAATAGGMPDGVLLEKLRAYFQTRREIAVDVQVLAPTARAVAVSVGITPAEGTTFALVKAETERVIRGWFNGTRLGKPLLRAELGKIIFGVEGVGNYKITAPGDDVAITAAQLPTLGTLTVTEL